MIDTESTDYDEQDDYFDQGKKLINATKTLVASIHIGLIEAHYEPADPTQHHQLPQDASNSIVEVSSICSGPRPEPDQIDSGSRPPSATVGNLRALDDSDAVCHTWEQQQSDELFKCSEFVRVTCSCNKANGKPCSGLFSEEHYTELRAQASFLTHEQLDLVILGSIMATIRKDDISHGRHKPAKRQKNNDDIHASWTPSLCTHVQLPSRTRVTSCEEC